MRTLVRLPFLLAILALSSRPTHGAERTWTIATDVVTAEAELVAVRGEMAYLKMGDRIESVPLARLSAADHEYIASLSLAPVAPGPADDVAESAVLPGPADDAPGEEVLPSPGDEAIGPEGFRTPDVDPAFGAPARQPAGSQANRQPTSQATVYRTDQYGRTTVLPPSGGPANYRSANADPRTAGNAGERRFWRPPQQDPNNTAASSRRDDSDDRPGLLGARARRLDRQRANAAARSR